MDDTGQERYGNLTRVYYRDAVGGFVVLDLGRPLAESLEIVKKWKGDIDSKSTAVHSCSPLFLSLSPPYLACSEQGCVRVSLCSLSLSLLSLCVCVTVRLWNGDALPVVLLANKVDLLGEKGPDERVRSNDTNATLDNPVVASAISRCACADR
jgi:GTPase SAR1 family protein